MINLNKYINEKLVIDDKTGLKENDVWYKFSSSKTMYCDYVFGKDLYVKAVKSKTLPDGCYVFWMTKQQIKTLKDELGNDISRDGQYRLQEVNYPGNIKKVIKWYESLKWPQDKNKFWACAKDIKFEDL